MLGGRELARFRNQLLAWFRGLRRDLPWRRTSDPYRIWLSEIMLQQTRVAAVIPYYERFLERFPDVRALAAAPQDEVLKVWSGLGYYGRARNLQKAAQQIVSKHAGEFPSSAEDVLALPGIGEYTVAAIRSIAFGEKAAVLDGNVARVLARIGAIRENIRERRGWLELQKTADTLLDPESPGDWNQALMELGATLCVPKAPRCLLCPLSRFCKGRQLGIAESLPEKRKMRASVGVLLAAAVFVDSQGRTLLLSPPKKTNESRADHIPALVSRMWHFPTIAVTGDPPAQFRTFLRKFLPDAKNGKFRLIPASRVRHTVTYRDITLLPFRVNVTKLPRAAAAKRVRLDSVASLPVSNLTRKVARAVLVAAARGPSSVALESYPLAQARTHRCPRVLP